MRYLIALFLIFVSGISFASVSRTEAENIYRKIISDNNIWIYPPLSFSDNGAINAYMTGYSIIINQGMLDITNTDELALVIGHELGHYKLHHIGSNYFNEYAADWAGWQYASNSGYNMCKGKELFKKFPQIYSSTHPHPKDRYNRLPKC